MATSEDSPALVTSGKRRAIMVAAVACGLVALALSAFFGVGRWLVVEDPLARAQAIAVLSGRMPVRAREAAKLYREGYAREVWLTRAAEPGESLQAMGIAYEGEEVYSTRVLRHEGVPAAAIHVLEPGVEVNDFPVRIDAWVIIGGVLRGKANWYVDGYPTQGIDQRAKASEIHS